MKLKCEELKNYIKKATINYVIDAIHIKVTKNKVSSALDMNNCISKIDISNNIFNNGKDFEFDIYINDPKTTLIPILFDYDEVDITIFDDYMEIVKDKQISKIYFCHESKVPDLVVKKNSSNLECLFSKNLNEDDILDYFDKIKKIGMKYGKIYFGVKDNICFIETGDKSNPFSNSLKFNLFEVNTQNFEAVFDYKTFFAILSIIDNNFRFNVSYFEDNDICILSFINDDKSECYYLLNKIDD